jgi:ribosomal protein L7/L12
MTMNPTLYAEIQRALAAGNKIAAIKLYREATSVGLAEAKAAVEAIELGRPVAPHAAALAPPAGDGRTVMALLASGNKIEAIKRYRVATGVGLKEAKDAVEAMETQAAASGALRPIVERPRRSGLAVVLAIVVIAVAAGFFFARTGK